jgi:hypothetical protein
MSERWRSSIAAITDHPSPQETPMHRPCAFSAALAPITLAAVTVLLAVAALGVQAAPATPLRVQPADIIDRQGFERPMRAMTMLLPAGWRHEGRVEWARTAGGCSKPYQPRLDARSADGTQAIVLSPGEGWGVTSFGALAQDCPAARFEHAEDYMRAWVQRHRPGARWIDWTPRADVSSAPVTQNMGQGAAMRQWREAGRATIAWNERGTAVQEILSVFTNFTFTHMPGLPGQAPMQTLAGEAHGVLAWRAPAGQLQPRQFDALWSTLRSDPAWAARIQQGMNQMAAENAATQNRISQIRAETGRQTIAEMGRRGAMAAQTRDEIAGMQNQGFRDRMASQDRQQVQTVKAIRGIETWRDTGGQVVELPNQYPHAWKLKDGSYVLTEDPNFRPGKDLGVDGEALQRQPAGPGAGARPQAAD